MRSSSLALLSLFLIVNQALVPSEVEAAGYAESRFFTGSRELAVVALETAVATASGTVYGVGVQTVSERRFSRQIPSARANVSTNLGDATWGLRSYFNPTTGGSSAAGGGLFFHTRDSESVNEFKGSWGLSASWVRHKVRNEPLSPPKRDKTFGEGVVEWNSRQSYFDSFNFQLSAAYFAYDRELGDVQRFKTTFQQNDVATLGTFASVTEPPEWSAAVQFARVFEDDQNGSVVFGYSRVGFHKGGRHFNSYLLGLQNRFGDNIGSRLGYNIVKGKGFSQAQYWGLTLSYYWR